MQPCRHFPNTSDISGVTAATVKPYTLLMTSSRWAALASPRATKHLSFQQAPKTSTDSQNLALLGRRLTDETRLR